MEITQGVMIIIAVLGALLVGMVAIVPTLLEMPGGHDEVSAARHPTLTTLRSRTRQRRPPETDAGRDSGQRWAA